jgi:hypothetical protein
MRPLWSLGRPLLGLIALTLAPGLALAWLGAPLPTLLVWPVLLVGTLAASRARWLLPLARRVCRFRTAASRRVRLHWAPEVGDAAALLPECEAILDELGRWFGFRPRRVAVFVFPRGEDLRRLLGPRFHAAAFPRLGAALLGADACMTETLRHELAHLYAARWNAWAPPLLAEGLAVWMQKTWFGQAVDEAAGEALRSSGLTCRTMLRVRVFFSETHRLTCYLLAGSFTGFLLCRYGWRRYRRLYRQASGQRFEACFRKCLGVSLEVAEGQWQDHLLALHALTHRLERELRP